MFEASCLLYLYVETPLHAGSGRGLAAVDLPIQRERITGYPLVQGSGVKGKLRDEVRNGINVQPPNKGAEMWKTIFGPETNQASDHAGALAPGDARLLLFPVRSLAGVFAWATSCDALARFRRDAATGKQPLELDRNGAKVQLQLPAEPAVDQALVAPGASIKAGGNVVLEEFSFKPVESPLVADIAEWLAANALPATPEYEYWRKKLPTSLVVLPENAFRDFTLYATEVVTRVRLVDEKKTVASGALWTEESLPTDTLLYLPLQATRARSYDNQGNRAGGVPNDWYDKGGGKKILDFVRDLNLARMQLGGDETVGRGMVCLRFGEVHNA
ncbi:MAG: type III-B CRISPR module RAMP protein Cmr4 [Caldilineales bacterium]|nr:type III-B CRISPR module RAMP protein Cmr4 [Caldilineales bacterium]MCW5858426.1 type III-B CRISPR module RAMP protein Cmr4 [Caldilineales bacterium]